MPDNVRITTDSDRIATVWLDLQGKSVNTFTPAMLHDLAAAVTTIESEKPAGVIFASAKPRGFVAGADLFEIKSMDQSQLEQFLRDAQQLFDRVEKLPMPTIAAINGDCLGGGLEFALACRYRVAVDDGSIKIGLPETKLGILPGWGGTVRLPRTIGLPRALPMMLAGKTPPPRKAMKAGIVDEIVRPEALLDAAKRMVKNHRKTRRISLRDRLLAITPMTRKKIFERARAETLATTYGNYPAPMKLIDVVQEGYEKGAAGGLDAERRALIDLSQTDASKNLMRIFFLRTAAKKAAAALADGKPCDVNYAAVIGGGTMGAGIVHALIRAGVQVRLVEVDVKAASAGLARVKGYLDDDVATGRITPLVAKHALNRVAPSIDWTGLGLADLVIEAVVEKMDVKKTVFAKLDKLTRPDAILASNTSSLSIAEMASAVADPSRVVGMHFFNPVPKMPLLEIVRSKLTGGDALATAVAVGARLGKSPVVSADAPGFIVNRVLMPYLGQALTMAGEGVPIAAIDDAMKKFGWPMGPFELLDEIGFDVAAFVLHELADHFADRVPIPRWIELPLQRGWLGKKTGRGFYIHGDKRKRNQPPAMNEELLKLISPHGQLSASPPSPEQIQKRLMTPMIDEANRLMSERVTDSAEAVDLATVLGLGFPPFRGGLMRYAASIGEAGTVPSRPQLAPVIAKPDFHPTHA